MNNLEGYNTDGFEYRTSLMDRNNSKRLKWMMKEAKDLAEKREKEEKNAEAYKKDKNSIIDKEEKIIGAKNNNDTKHNDNNLNTLSNDVSKSNGNNTNTLSNGIKKPNSNITTPSNGLSKPAGNSFNNNMFKPREFNRINTFRNNMK